ncbi:MAG: hypothetical protein WA628_01340 [Terriglobales bacterium]
MAVDWDAVRSAIRHSRNGNHLKAVEVLSNLMTDAESDSDRAAIILGEASCHSQLGDLGKSRELLELAKVYAQGDRDVLSQVEFAEASLDALNKECELACERFISLRSKYHDLVAENDDFASELDSRLACALVDAGKYTDAVPIFEALFQREQLEDKQRLQLFFGVAQMRNGHAAEAQALLLSAAKDEDAALSKSALEYLAGIQKVQ